MQQSESRLAYLDYNGEEPNPSGRREEEGRTRS
jgi:hypothetical protein